MYGIDLSRRMVHEAHRHAQTLGRHNTAFCQADAEALPFGHHVCDLVTCKSAFHYFPHPQVALSGDGPRRHTRVAHGGVQRRSG